MRRRRQKLEVGAASLISNLNSEISNIILDKICDYLKPIHTYGVFLGKEKKMPCDIEEYRIMGVVERTMAGRPKFLNLKNGYYIGLNVYEYEPVWRQAHDVVTKRGLWTRAIGKPVTFLEEVEENSELCGKRFRLGERIFRELSAEPGAYLFSTDAFETDIVEIE